MTAEDSDGQGLRRRRAGGSGARRWAVGLGIVSVALLVVGVVAYVRLRTETTPISVEDAVARFPTSVAPPMATGSGATVPPLASTSAPVAPSTPAGPSTAPVPVPAPGVYAYTATGGESLDVLMGATRAYPAETPVVVETATCGVVVSWTPLQERAETFELCPEAGGLLVVRTTSTHEFFGQREVRSLECDADAWLVPPGAVAGTTWDAVCSGSGLVEQRRSTLVERAAATVGGVAVDAVVVETVVSTTGTTVGTTTRRLTLDVGTGLPIEWVDEVHNSTATPAGDAGYTEQVRLVAASLTPES